MEYDRRFIGVFEENLSQHVQNDGDNKKGEQSQATECPHRQIRATLANVFEDKGDETHDGRMGITRRREKTGET